VLSRSIRRKKRSSSYLARGSPLPVFAIIGFPLLLLWRPLFADEAFFWGTPLLQFVPWYRMVADFWLAGRLPLWNSLVGCGAPLAANYQAAAFYPLNALILALPVEVALTWTTALHMMLAGWGVYRWFRALGLDEAPSTIGALAFSGGGFLVGRAALFPSVALTFPWVGVWLWRAEVLVQRGRLRDALSLGGALGMGLLAGHAQTAFYGGLLLATYVAFRIIQVLKRDVKGVLGLQVLRWCFMLTLAGGVGLGLAAVQLLPTAELMLSSQRSAGVDATIAMTYSMWPWRLLTLFAPDLFGNPGYGDYWGFATYWEDAAYVGVLPALLAMSVVFARRTGCTRDSNIGRSTITFWVLVCTLAIVLALGSNTPVFPFLFQRVPTFDWFQAPARWLAVATVGFSALSAIGLQVWPLERGGTKRAVSWVVTGLALILGGLTAPRLVPGIEETFGSATVRLGILSTLSGLLMALRSGQTGQGRDVSLGWYAAAVVFVMADLLLFGWPLLPTIDRELYSGSTELASMLNASPELVRIYWPRDPTYRDREFDAHERVKFTYLTFSDFGPTEVAYWRGMREILMPNTGILENVASINNFEPMQVGRYNELLRAIAEEPDLLRITGATHVVSDRSWPGSQAVWSRSGVTAYRLENTLGRAWVVPWARVVPTDEMLSVMADDGFDAAREVLVEGTQGVLRMGSPGDYRVVLRDAPNRVTIAAVLTAPGYLVIADTWYPGWRATVDGQAVELLRANYAFRAVWLEAGEHVVEMVYRPASVQRGLVITVTTGLGLIIAVAILAGGRD